MKHPGQAIRDIQHFGEEGGVVPVIDVASTSTFLNPEDMEKTFTGEIQGCYLYSRHSNPTVNIFGMKLAAMEGAEAAVGVASGMAAISSAIDQVFLNAGKVKGHIVAARTVYGGTYALFKNVLPSKAIRVSFVDITNLEEVENSIEDETLIMYAETLSNPLLSATDIEALSRLCKKKKITLIIDNTFAPMLARPISLGADIVVHSCTKYISGSSDCIAGAIVGSKDFIASLIDVNKGVVMLGGPVMDPRIAHELYLRLDHLGVRMQGHSEAALYFARKMRDKKLPVIYPGLEEHPQHALVKKQFHPQYGFGGILTLECEDSNRARDLAMKLQDAKFGLYAVSLGFSRTLMSCSAKSTSSEIPEDEQKKMGISAGLLRFSMGYTGDLEIMWKRFTDCL